MRWLVLFFGGVLVAPFEVNAPDKHLLALRGHSAVLGCEFTPDLNLSNLVVTWQREEDSQVVHSFYYQQDQLERQSPEYHSRTSLFVTELHKGNASIRIAAVSWKDAGRYLCIVSNTKGTGRASMEVTYGALYSEPRLSIHLNSSALTVEFETEGFPKPEVIWVDEHDQTLSCPLELLKHTEDGLYLIKSRYEVKKQVVNVTFTLKNHLLNQNIHRPVIFSYDENIKSNPGTATVVVLSLVCIVLLIGVIWLTLVRRKKLGSTGATNHNHQCNT